MRDIVLLVCVIVYMIGGYFVIGKIGAFLDENYKDYDCYDNSNDKTNHL